MPAQAQRLRLRLFLEGVEVPIIGAQIQTLPNAPIVAAIQIPPVAEATRLLPRTLVHLYFLDFYEAESPFIAERQQSATTTQERNPTAYERGRSQREFDQEFNEATGGDVQPQADTVDRDNATDDRNERT